MGYNLISACHRCRVQIYHMRGHESDHILSFYKAHADCAKKEIGYVVTIMDNNGTDQTWEPGGEESYLIINDGYVKTHSS